MYVLAGLLVFLFVYQNTSSSVAWIYTTETGIDAGLGFCLFTLWGTVFVLSLVCPLLMSDPEDGGIGQSNVFFMLGGFAIVAVFYVQFFMIETRGLTDKQKKELFTPKKYLTEDDN